MTRLLLEFTTAHPVRALFCCVAAAAVGSAGVTAGFLWILNEGDES